jgi:hypothetical protein
VPRLAPDDLRARCESARHRPTLVLGPHVPEPQVSFFETRAKMFPGRVRCVQPNGGSPDLSPRERLRDLAKRHRNALVVVNDDREKDFYAGAGVRTTRVEPAHSGFRVVAIEDLLPQLPGRLEDDDGMQMLPEPEIENRYRKVMGWGGQKSDERWTHRIREADEAGTPVTFRLDWLLVEWGGRAPQADEIERAALQKAISILRKSARPDDDVRLDFICVHAGRALALCTGWGDLARSRVGTHVTVHDLSTFEPLVLALVRICEGLNPYGEGGAFDLSAELRAFETGIQLGFTTEAIRQAVCALHEKGNMCEGTAVGRGPDLDAKVCALLDDLLGREMVLPASRASVVRLLELVRRAPLLHLRADELHMSALADIGTGNLLRLEVTKYPGERPAAVRLWSTRGDTDAKTLDGGDVRVSWERSFDPFLEGTSLSTVERRRKAVADEARRSAWVTTDRREQDLA